MSNNAKSEPKKSCALWRGVKSAAKVAVYGAAAAALANAWLEYNSTPPGPRFDAAYERYPSRFGDIAYAVQGQGDPLLLLHAPRVGASMGEWAHVANQLAQHHTVYALDFLGWGNSDRTRALRRAPEMVEEIQFFIEDVIGKPSSVMASGQSCALAAAAAAQTPELIEKLILVCPTSEQTDVLERVLWHGHWPPQLLVGIQKSAEVLSKISLCNTSLSNLFTTQSVITNIALELFHDSRHADQALINRMHNNVHQSGQRAEIISHFAGTLDLDWQTPWAQCEQQTLLIWGKQAPAEATDTATEWLALNPNAQLQMIDDAKYLPHYEQAQAFLKVVKGWETSKG